MGDDDALDAYRLHQQRRGHEPHSIATRYTTLRQFRHFLGAALLLTATSVEIDSWLDSKVLAPKSRSWHISNLSCFYRFCVSEGYVATDPTVRVAKPRLPRLLPRPMAEDDLLTALDLATPRMRCWLLLAGYAGLRCKEIGALRRDHILEDSDPPLLVVHAGKGGHQRVIPVHPRVMNALRVFGMPRSGPLWPGLHAGRGLTAGYVSQSIASYLKGIGIPATAHNGRHYFGTRVQQLGHDLRLTQELLGHASPATTAGYTAWDRAAAAGVVVQIGAVTSRT